MREMKDSGHETIGLVPSDWTEKRLKYLCKIQTGNEDTQNANPDGKYPFYVRSPIVEHCDRYTFDGEGILVAGDGAGAGRIFHHVYGKYAVHQRVYRLSHFAGNADFIYYYLSNLFPHEMDKGSAQSTVPSMRLPMLLNFPLFLPSKKEQDKIVTFLDSKCSEIDAISADIQKEIETLEQYKRSVITEAVTKGLNPDVEMKDSGIKYIGAIPSAWTIRRIKDIYTLQTGFTPDTKQSDYYDDENGLDWITIADLGSEKNIPKSTKSKISRKYVNLFRPVPTPKGSLLYSFKLSVGQVAFTDRLIFTNEAIASFLPTNDVCLNFLYYAAFLIEYNANTNIYGAHILNQQLIKNAHIVNPPIDEQHEIAKYLDSKCLEIDAIVFCKKQQIETLSRYKKSLIYEYVTGKKEVPA